MRHYKLISQSAPAALLALLMVPALASSSFAADQPPAADDNGAATAAPTQAAPADQPPAAPARKQGPAVIDPAMLADLSRVSAQSPTAMEALINRLVQRGALSKQDSAEILLIADAEAADARAQAALTQAALAVAAAAQARARAMVAQANSARMSPAQAVAVAAAQAEEAKLAALAAAADNSAPPSAAPDAPAPASAGVVAAAASDDDAPAPAPTPAPRAVPAKRRAKVVAAAASPAPDEPPVPDDVVRVTYVPDVVKEQIRQEVTQDVLDDARKEGWATPSAIPEWISRITVFGDFRLRFQSMRYPSGNDDTGAFPNFNAINTGSPYDTAGTNYPPEFNVNQDRTLERLRVRLGFAVDMGQNFSVGLRLASGNDDQPVSENQTLGAAGNAQGGDFSKYNIWLDRAFVKYEVGGKPDEDAFLEVGRMDNPFMSTTMIWAQDLGFDGFVASGKYHIGESITPFLTVGAFPVFDTDLNFPSNQTAKAASDNKWLYAAQLGATFDLGESVVLKVAVADYKFHNIQGQLSTPFTPLSSADIGNTDDSRPAFAQIGNTYFPIRDIVADSANDNGTIDQFQYYGLASKFDELTFDTKLDFNQFEPFQISLEGEYVKNRGFNQAAVGAIAVNNFASSTTGDLGPYEGSGSAWYIRMTIGSAALQATGDWNVNLGYRSVGSDAVVDGFADADFGGGGTNFKGPTLGAGYAITNNVWMRAVWMSASQVGGPQLKNDILQVDLNAKF